MPSLGLCRTVIDYGRDIVAYYFEIMRISWIGLIQIRPFSLEDEMENSHN